MRIVTNFSGAKLKEARTRKGISQADLAKCIGVSNGNIICKWEKGICKPNLKSVRALDSYFGVHDEYWNAFNDTEYVNEMSKHDLFRKMEEISKRIDILESRIDSIQESSGSTLNVNLSVKSELSDILQMIKKEVKFV